MNTNHSITIEFKSNLDFHYVLQDFKEFNLLTISPTETINNTLNQLSDNKFVITLKSDSLNTLYQLYLKVVKKLEKTYYINENCRFTITLTDLDTTNENDKEFVWSYHILLGQKNNSVSPLPFKVYNFTSDVLQNTFKLSVPYRYPLDASKRYAGELKFIVCQGEKIFDRDFVLNYFKELNNLLKEKTDITKEQESIYRKYKRIHDSFNNIDSFKSRFKNITLSYDLTVVKMDPTFQIHKDRIEEFCLHCFPVRGYINFNSATNRVEMKRGTMEQGFQLLNNDLLYMNLKKGLIRTSYLYFCNCDNCLIVETELARGTYKNCTFVNCIIGENTRVENCQFENCKFVNNQPDHTNDILK